MSDSGTRLKIWACCENKQAQFDAEAVRILCAGGALCIKAASELRPRSHVLTQHRALGLAQDCSDVLITHLKETSLIVHYDELYA